LISVGRANQLTSIILEYEDWKELSGVAEEPTERGGVGESRVSGDEHRELVVEMVALVGISVMP
jgi:hypothetical protein